MHRFAPNYRKALVSLDDQLRIDESVQKGVAGTALCFVRLQFGPCAYFSPVWLPPSWPREEQEEEEDDDEDAT